MLQPVVVHRRRLEEGDAVDFFDELGFWQTTVWRDTSLSITSFGEDDNGEIYLAHRGGTIYKFKVPDEIFEVGFESGDTTLWSSSSL